MTSSESEEEPDTGLSLDAAEKSGDIAAAVLLWQEEKMARDLYREFFRLWGLRIFEWIANSEQRHMAHVQYAVEQMTGQLFKGDTTPGNFTDQHLQELYAELFEQGAESLQAALLAGASLEEQDIVDLIHIRKVTESAVLHDTCSRLMRGSERHLKAFCRQLERRGVPCLPQVLPPVLHGEVLAGQADLRLGCTDPQPNPWRPSDLHRWRSTGVLHGRQACRR